MLLVKDAEYFDCFSNPNPSNNPGVMSILRDERPSHMIFIILGNRKGLLNRNNFFFPIFFSIFFVT